VTKAAKRANRDEGIEELISYYDRGFKGMMIKEFKSIETHPERIKALLTDGTNSKKLS
jgi:hypothetical protein